MQHISVKLAHCRQRLVWLHTKNKCAKVYSCDMNNLCTQRSRTKFCAHNTELCVHKLKTPNSFVPSPEHIHVQNISMCTQYRVECEQVKDTTQLCANNSPENNFVHTIQTCVCMILIMHNLGHTSTFLRDSTQYRVECAHCALHKHVPYHQGCRICGSLGAGLPDTFFFGRHFFYEQTLISIAGT